MDPAHERNNTIALLRDTASRLEASVHADLIPPEGLAFGYAIHGARDAGGVAVVNIGIQNKRAPAAGPCTFGTDSPVIRIVLTAMKFNPAIRSAAILHYTDKAAGIMEDEMLLECDEPDPATAGRAISTMDWGIASCCREGIPDVIFTGSDGNSESRIILFGEKPDDVCNNIIICSNRI